jgi:site-specific DNA-methyltransferase (adenine-specific)
MKSEVVFSRQSDEWETPQALFDLLDKEFHFTLDAAATKDNSKCGPRYADKIGGSLTINWAQHSQGGAIWLNPPYSKIKDFIKKAYEESLKGSTVVCLIPSRTDTRYWHDYVMKAAEIRFIKGRLKFGGATNGAPFPSCIVVFDNCYSREDNDLPRVSSIKVPA